MTEQTATEQTTIDLGKPEVDYYKATARLNQRDAMNQIMYAKKSGKNRDVIVDFAKEQTRNPKAAYVVLERVHVPDDEGNILVNKTIYKSKNGVKAWYPMEDEIRKVEDLPTVNDQTEVVNSEPTF